MGFSFVSYFVMLMMLMGGSSGGLDLLDTVPTETYWQVKNVSPTLDQLQLDAGPQKPPVDVEKRLKELQSEDFTVRETAKKQLEAMGPAAIPSLKPATVSTDAEVAAVARDLVKRFSEQGKDRDIRRLMAIRTLGERREKAALPILKELVNSREMFVSDYALRAVAAIEGKPLTTVDHQKELAADVALLPKNSALILQTAGAAVMPRPMTLTGLVDSLIDAAKQPGMMGNNLGKIDRQQMIQMLTRHTLKVVDRVGNIQIHGFTLAISDDIGAGAGSVQIIVRGKYDPAAVCDALHALNANEKAAPNLNLGDLKRMEFNDDLTMLFPSDDRMIMVIADKKEFLAKAAETTAAALKNGTGTLHENADITALLARANTAAPIWGVGKLTKEMQQEKLFEGFDTLLLETAKINGGGLSYTFSAKGADDKKLAASVELLNTGITEARQTLQNMVAQAPFYKPMVEFFDVMKVTAQGNTGKLTGEFKPALVESIISQAGPLLMMGMQELPQVQEVPQIQEGVGQDGGAAPAR